MYTLQAKLLDASSSSIGYQQRMEMIVFVLNNLLYMNKRIEDCVYIYTFTPTVDTLRSFISWHSHCCNALFSHSPSFRPGFLQHGSKTN